MKLPRGVSADRLIRALKGLDYEVVRQRGAMSGCGIRDPPPHMITVPLHHLLKTGTLHGILSEVAWIRSITIDSLAELL